MASSLALPSLSARTKTDRDRTLPGRAVSS
jgi:hypothetical protein